MKDKDPQLYASGYERNRLDRYWTNPWMTNELFKHVDSYIPDCIWEPAAGRGDMSRAIKENGRVVYSSDIDTSELDHTIGPYHEKSFLDEVHIPRVRDYDEFGVSYSGEVYGIITNPPYSEPWRGIADDFINHGLSFFYQGIYFMAMLMRSEFKSGKTRAGIFGDCPHYMGELVLTTRPRWDYGDPDAPENAAPRHNFSWFLWRKDWQENDRPIQLFSYMPKGFKP